MIILIIDGIIKLYETKTVFATASIKFSFYSYSVLSYICFNKLQTVASYIEAPNSSSLYNLHETTSGIYGMTHSEHISNRQPTAQQRFKHINQNANSQSDTNLPNLQNYSPTNIKAYSRLGK